MDGLVRAGLMLLRQRHLQRQLLTANATDSNAPVSAANTDALVSDSELLTMNGSDEGSGSSFGSADADTDALLSDEEQAFTNEQLRVLTVNGVLSLVLFTALAVAVLYMTIVHFRSGSGRRKKVFHMVLFVSIILNLPDPLGWVFWPETDKWKPTYVMRVYSVLLQSACKSYLAFCWAEVVAAGRSDARRRMLAVVLVLNALLTVWAVAVLVILAPYANDVYGQYDFMLSRARDAVTYTGISVVLAFGLLLLLQGMRLRGRLLQAKGLVPAGSVEKSLVQLLLTVSIIVTADAVRVVSVFLAGKIPFTPLNVTNSLIPTIFPTICMLYLMRRVPRSNKHKAKASASHGNGSNSNIDATLSRFMDSESDKRPASDISDAYAASSSKFALGATRVSNIARLEHDDQQQQSHPLHPSHQSPALSPPFVWSSRNS